MADGLDEISHTLGVVEGEVRAQNEALRELRAAAARDHEQLRKDLGREIGEVRKRADEHSRSAAALEKDGLSRLQDLEAWREKVEEQGAVAIVARQRRDTLVLAGIGIAFTVVNTVIAAVALLNR